jgi:hypothetical protein
MRTRPGRVETEIHFRIVHVAPPDRDGYREQTVEITLGPKGAFGKDFVVTLTRRAPVVGHIVRADRPRRCKSKSPRVAKTPRVVELLHKANEWQREIDAGKVRNRAEIARREGITRARVTQVMALLHLAPETRKDILAMPETIYRSAISERALRSVAQRDSHQEQRAAFGE